MSAGRGNPPRSAGRPSPPAGPSRCVRVGLDRRSDRANACGRWSATAGRAGHDRPSACRRPCSTAARGPPVPVLIEARALGVEGRRGSAAAPHRSRASSRATARSGPGIGRGASWIGSARSARAFASASSMIDRRPGSTSSSSPGPRRPRSSCRRPERHRAGPRGDGDQAISGRRNDAGRSPLGRPAPTRSPSEKTIAAGPSHGARKPAVRRRRVATCGCGERRSAGASGIEASRAGVSSQPVVISSSSDSSRESESNPSGESSGPAASSSAATGFAPWSPLRPRTCSRLPRTVLISPLWAIERNGWASSRPDACWSRSAGGRRCSPPTAAPGGREELRQPRARDQPLVDDGPAGRGRDGQSARAPPASRTAVSSRRRATTSRRSNASSARGGRRRRHGSAGSRSRGRTRVARRPRPRPAPRRRRGPRASVPPAARPRRRRSRPAAGRALRRRGRGAGTRTRRPAGRRPDRRSAAPGRNGRAGGPRPRRRSIPSAPNAPRWPSEASPARARGRTRRRSAAGVRHEPDAARIVLVPRVVERDGDGSAVAGSVLAGRGHGQVSGDGWATGCRRWGRTATSRRVSDGSGRRPGPGQLW